TTRLVGVVAERRRRRHVAERTTAGASVAADEECRFSFFPALRDVRAHRFFADRVQSAFARYPLEVLEVRAAAEPHFEPGRLAPFGDLVHLEVPRRSLDGEEREMGSLRHG